MNYTMYPVFTTEALAELLGVDDDIVRDEILHYEYNNDSCVFYDYTLERDESEVLANKLNKVLKSSNLPTEIILIDVSW